MNYMIANKQCPYRSQEHVCKSGFTSPSNTYCNHCLEGQKVDAIELIASALMEKSNLYGLNVPRRSDEMNLITDKIEKAIGMKETAFEFVVR